MRVFLVALLAALAYAQTEYSDEEPRTKPLVTNPPKLHFVDLDDGLSGKYNFGFDTGTSELGQVFRQEKKLDDGTVIGRYGYVDSNGKQRIVNYSAGVNGFQATGDIGPDKDGPAVGRVVPNNPAPAPTHRPNPRPRPAPRRPVQQPPQQQYQPPQQQYVPPQERYTGIPQQQQQPPQQQYRPPQQQYRPPQQQYFPPQERYTGIPQQQQPPQQQYFPPPQQQYIPRPPPQQQYIPRPPPQQQYIPRPPPPQVVAPRPTPGPGPITTNEEPDYGPPVVPTNLLSYGFGTDYDARN